MILKHPRYDAIVKYKKACIAAGLPLSEIYDKIQSNFKKRGLWITRSTLTWYV